MALWPRILNAVTPLAKNLGMGRTRPPAVGLNAATCGGAKRGFAARGWMGLWPHILNAVTPIAKNLGMGQLRPPAVG
ncbi:MAG TPA: hypothetical protein VGL22_04560 [Terracidiphilus sp.]